MLYERIKGTGLKVWIQFSQCNSGRRSNCQDRKVSPATFCSYVVLRHTCINAELGITGSAGRSCFSSGARLARRTSYPRGPIKAGGTRLSRGSIYASGTNITS